MNTVVSLRNFLLLAAVVLVAASIPISERLQFDQRIESFFAEDNPDLKILERSRRDFGGDEFVIVAWTEERLFNIAAELDYPETLNDVLGIKFLPEVSDTATARIETTTEQLNKIPGVNAAQTQHLPGLLHKAPRYRPARQAMVRMFEGSLVGQDGRTTGVLLQLQTEEDAGVARGDTLKRIREVADALSADVGEVAVAGEPVQVFDMFEIVEEDGQILFLVSLVILASVLLLMFRGLRWVLAPVGLVLGAAIATRAILVLVGAELSMVSSMMNSLVTVIGIATFMHVIVHYRDLRTKHAATLLPTDSADSAGFGEVAQQTLRDMAVPVFWTCVTTGVGFASLLVSQITPVRSFAIMMCLATAVVFVGCCVIMPATLASGSRLRRPAQVPLEHWLDRALSLTCRAVETRPVVAGLICTALFVGSIPGVLSLEIETDFSKNFKESSTIVRSLKFVEGRLGGAGSWEVSFDTPEETSEHYVLNDDFLAQVRRLTEDLREMTVDDDSIRVLSMTDIGEIPPKILFGTPTKSLAKIRRLQPLMIENFYNNKARRMRIVLRSKEQQPTEKKAQQIIAIRECVRKFFEAERVAAQEARTLREAQAAAESGDGDSSTAVTVALPFLQETPPAASGMFVLLAELILSLLEDQLKSFIVASVGILLCITVAFRSLRLGIISLFPNVFPVAVVMGTLGWIGSPVNIGTAMIASVSMGLTVDSTIHYITAFERARRNTTVANALQIAHSGAGRAVVFAHLALVAGFLVLTASRFVPLVYFGALLSLSMIGGLFGDLVLLPLLLRWTTPETVLADADGT